MVMERPSRWTEQMFPHKAERCCLPDKKCMAVGPFRESFIDRHFACISTQHQVFYYHHLHFFNTFFSLVLADSLGYVGYHRTLIFSPPLRSLG